MICFLSLSLFLKKKKMPPPPPQETENISHPRQKPHPDTQPRDEYSSGCSHTPKAEKKQLVAKGLPPAKSSSKHLLETVGRVVHAESLEEMVTLAAERDNKGISWDRGAHPLTQEIDAWLDTIPEKKSFAKETFVAPTTNETLEAKCTDLVKQLPEGPIRDAVKKDAKMMAELLLAWVPEVPRWALQLEVTGNNRCSRWHVDHYVGRVVCTYVGPSTWVVDDESVCFEQFEATGGVCWEESDSRIVPGILVFGFWFLVFWFFGFWFLVFGFWFLVFGFWFLVFVFCFLFFVFCFLFFVFCFLFFVFRFLFCFIIIILILRTFQTIL